MKTTYFMAALAGLMALGGCKDDDHVTPNEAVLQAFSTKYPTATRVEWEPKNSYLTADFVADQLSHTAWFSATGEWYMTETELNNIVLLPEDVLAGFKASEYAGWITEDVDRLERHDKETLYVIEVKKGNQEVDLYFSPEGILVKTIADDRNDDYVNELPTPTPSAIAALIEAKYPGARIVETDIETYGTEVDVIHENRKKEVLFNTKNEWVSTHYDVIRTAVDATVLEALAKSEYAAYAIDDIEKYETPTGNYYRFELEKGATEVNIQIDMNGTITVVRG